MFAQPFLPDLEPKSVHSLFFAILPDWASANQALAVAEGARRRNGLLGNPIKRSNLHVSLQGVGLFYDALPKPIVTKALASASMVREAALEVRFDRVGSYRPAGDTSPLVLYSKAHQLPLIAFHRALGEAMRRHGLRRVSGTLTPHMTLLYDGRLLPSTEVEPVAWTAREFVLIHSVIGLGRHDILGCWSLKGPGR